MRRLCIVSIVITSITGQRRQFIQDLITRLKTSPRRQSISPSWSSDRQFDVIGTGPLPLQNHNLENNFETDLLETQYIPTLAPTSGQSRYESDSSSSSSSRPLPGQFSRNRLSNSDRTYFQTQTQSGQFYQQQDPEMFDTWSTSWPQYPSSDSRRRSKRSPYKRIKLKIGNPFYYPGSRRRVRVKKVISADPVYHRETSRSYHQHEVGAGYHRLWNDDNHYDDDQLQQLTIVDVNDFNRETESLQNDDDQESHLSDEARELLGSGNFIIEKGGTFYDDDVRSFSEYLPDPYNENHVDNFRDFADIKQERLYNMYRSKLRSRNPYS